jgi:dTMP kinase
MRMEQDMNDRGYTGILITFEGIEGVGKSTAARRLFEELSKSYDVVLTKEPGATVLGKKLREFLQQRSFEVSSKAEYLLFAADRAQHFEELIIPCLKQGKIVISDRMADSSYAYQGFGWNVDPEMIKVINQWSMQSIEPDLTFYLDLDYETAIARLEKRNEMKTFFERQSPQFFKRVIQGFQEILATRSAVKNVDARLPEEQVHQEIVRSVAELLNTFGY